MIMRIVVDLPDPFGPRKPVTVPGRTSKLSRSTATVLPKRWVSPLASITITSPPQGVVPADNAPHARACHADHARDGARAAVCGYRPGSPGGKPPVRK